MKKMIVFVASVLSSFVIASDWEIIEAAQNKVKAELIRKSEKKAELCLNVAQAVLITNQKVQKDTFSMCGEFSTEIVFSDSKAYSLAVCGKVKGKDIIGNPIESDYIYQRATKDFYFNYNGKKSAYYDPQSDLARLQEVSDSMFNAMQNR
ncbi:TPA: hypothetical protein RSV43_001742, partial [Mannheimia haemolytica]|nr:hypothetical protein [Mannheimia haemolytica]HDL5826144.1 hypothetical protein [Mannheimia haemolytica]HDL5902982.1 hypothetical protein [Mannheimia haemolytica]HDZ3571450.1 hypothetical protein [Mannheimia haemolytica]